MVMATADFTVRDPLSREAAALLLEQEKALREARDLTWFWEIVDRDGLNNVCSDERGALAELVRVAKRAEAENAKLREALKPFALFGHAVGRQWLVDDPDVIRARAALGKE
jgi:hypothetical protein